MCVCDFFFNAAATTGIYTLSLHDALPISQRIRFLALSTIAMAARSLRAPRLSSTLRSEEHTSELQSRENLVCRLLLEKKKRLSAARGAPSGRDDSGVAALRRVASPEAVAV